jgi:polyisoprenoid-binding protein YceI
MSPALRSLLVPAALVLTLVLCGVPQKVRAQAAGGVYQVDTRSSRVYIKVGSTTRLGHPHGVQGDLAGGKITLGGPGELVFDMASFTADTPEARRYVGLPEGSSDGPKVTANMQGPDVLDVAHYPQATFAIAGAAPMDGQQAGQPGRYVLDGRFTLHGTTQAVRIAANLEQTSQPGVLRLRGSFTISQTAYGIRPYTALGGLVGVSDPLEIWGDLILVPGGR